jgi:hypothetical protein
MDCPSVYRAPLGVPLPFTSTSVLDTSFADIGRIENDIVMESTSTTNNVTSWGGGVVASLQERFSHEIKFTMQTHDTTWRSIDSMMDTSTWVFDTRTTTTADRVVIPVGRVVSVDSHVISHGGSSAITLKAFPDVDRNSIYHYDRPLTWEETWHEHCLAAMEGETERAAALLAELTMVEKRFADAAAAVVGYDMQPWQKAFLRQAAAGLLRHK